jgi:hypothetical protein
MCLVIHVNLLHNTLTFICDTLSLYVSKYQGHFGGTPVLYYWSNLSSGDKAVWKKTFGKKLAQVVVLLYFVSSSRGGAQRSYFLDDRLV